MESNQRAYAILLCHAIIDFITDLGIPDWVKKAIVSSLEHGVLYKIFERALEDAYNRGTLSVHQSITPIVEIPDAQKKLSIPTEPRVNRTQPRGRERISTFPMYRPPKINE